MEIPYKYIVLVLVILAIVCIIMTVECFSSKEDEGNTQYNEIKEILVEGFNANVNQFTVAADSVVNNLSEADEKALLETPRFQLATKYLSTENGLQIYNKLFQNLKLNQTVDGNYVMAFNPDSGVNLNNTSVGDYLAEHIDTHLQDILANQFPALTTSQLGTVYRRAKIQLKTLMRQDTKEYHEAIRYASLKENGDGQVEYQDGVVAIPGIDEFIENLIGPPQSTPFGTVLSGDEVNETSTSFCINQDGVCLRDENDEEIHYIQPQHAIPTDEESSLALDEVVQMLTHSHRKLLTLDTSNLPFIDGETVAVELPENVVNDLPSPEEIYEQIKDTVINLKSSNEDISRELNPILRRRVRYNRDLVANSISTLLNSRAIRKGWDWRKQVNNNVISSKTNISPHIIYSTPLSKIARIINIDEDRLFNEQYPDEYKFIRARGIINKLGALSADVKNKIFDTLFNLNIDEYNSLEETLALPLTTSLHPLDQGTDDASNRSPEVIVDTEENDEYALQKIETVLTHTTIEGIYQCNPARFIRSNKATDSNGEIIHKQCKLGLPLYVYDYKPTESGTSSILRKVGRGRLVGNMIKEEYTNSDGTAKGELAIDEVIFMTYTDYNTNDNETGLVLSNGDFVYEGEDQTEKLIREDMVNYIIAKNENVNGEVQKVYKENVGDNLEDFTYTNLQDWTVSELRELFGITTNNVLRNEIALLQEFINKPGLLEDSESNFLMNDLHLFPITYRDSYPLVPLNSLKSQYPNLNRRNFTYPEDNMITGEMQEIQVSGQYNMESFSVMSKKDAKARNLIRVIEGYNGELTYGPSSSVVATDTMFSIEVEPGFKIENLDSSKIKLFTGEDEIEVAQNVTLVEAEADNESQVLSSRVTFNFNNLLDNTEYSIVVEEGAMEISDITDNTTPIENTTSVAINDWNFTTSTTVTETINNWPENIKEVLAAYRVVGVNTNGTTMYQRDQPALLNISNSVVTDGIDISTEGLTPNKLLEPILKCSDPSTGLGQSVIFGEQGDLLVQVIRKESEIAGDVNGQMERDSNGQIVDFNVHRRYIDSGNLEYKIEGEIDINLEIGWKVPELKDLFNVYKSALDSESITLNQDKLRANCYDLVLINKLIVIIANSKLKEKDAKLNKTARNNVDLVLNTAFNNDISQDLKNNLYSLISNSLSNTQICKSGGSSEISVDDIKKMGVMNFKSIFESGISHVESLNLHKTSQVMIQYNEMNQYEMENNEVILSENYLGNVANPKPLPDVNGMGVYFLTYTDINRLLKSIFGSYSGYIDPDDLQSDTMFGIIKIYDIINDSGKDLTSWLESKSIKNPVNKSGLEIITEALDNLRSDSNSSSKDFRWRTGEDEATWLNGNIYSNQTKEDFSILSRKELHSFMGSIFENITLEEFFSTRMYTVGAVPNLEAETPSELSIDISSYIQTLEENAGTDAIKKAHVTELKNKYGLNGPMATNRIEMIADVLNSNLLKRYDINQNMNKINKTSLLGDIRNLFTGNIKDTDLQVPYTDNTSSTGSTSIQSTDASTIINNININKEDFSPLDNRSEKIESANLNISGLSVNDKYFNLDNSYSLLN